MVGVVGSSPIAPTSSVLKWLCFVWVGLQTQLVQCFASVTIKANAVNVNATDVNAINENRTLYEHGYDTANYESFYSLTVKVGRAFTLVC